MLAALASTALAQDYRLPIADEHAEFAYPTAYKDHGGVDWGCGDIRYDGHQGTDFGIGSWDGMAAGRTIVAAAPGVVIATHDGEPDDCTTGDCSGDEVYGNHVRLRHADGKETVYGHMKTGSVSVSVGDGVACGLPLGQVGSSGWSTGPHLHFGVWDPASAAYVDPYWGDCSGAPSYWVEQGDYGALPGLACADAPACEPVATLGCGDHLEQAADAPGTTSTHAFWGSCSEFSEYTGPETSFTVVPDREGAVQVRLSALTADLDLFAIPSDTCDATECLGASTEGDASDETLVLAGEPGVPITIAVDGFRGATSGFVIDVACDGDPPDTDPPDTDVGPIDTDPSESDARPKPGCGCSHRPNTWAGPWLVLAAAALVARRRQDPTTADGAVLAGPSDRPLSA